MNIFSKTLTFLFSFFLFFSCQKKEEKLTITREKMAKILADIHIAEGAATYLNDIRKDSMMKIYCTQICQIHEVNEVEFKQNMELLKRNPLELQYTYKIVKDSIDSYQKNIR